MGTSKEEAIKEIAQIEQRTKELRRIIEESDRPKPITERVKSYEDACAILCLTPHQVGIMGISDCKLNKSLAAYIKLSIINKALNEGWEADWKNGNEYKHYPYFVYSGSGFRFNLTYYHFTGAYVGSRLYFKTRELAEYAGKQFTELYKEAIGA